jgi:hypothetical protein
MTTTTPTLEDTLRDLAKRGELSHVSIASSQNGKMFRASFAMCSYFGVSYAEDADPAKAMLLACTTAKMKRHRVTLDLKAERVEKTIAADEASGEVDEYLAGIKAHVTDQSVEDLM